MKNKFGLSRYIPSDVKLQVRKNSGFGCVICGMGIIHYEHVDPEFHVAQTHDPDKWLCCALVAMERSLQECGPKIKLSRQ